MRGINRMIGARHQFKNGVGVGDFDELVFTTSCLIRAAIVPLSFMPIDCYPFAKAEEVFGGTNIGDDVSIGSPHISNHSL